ncbi:TIGR01777 family oxidoreductase [Nocardiopsis lambiniae]|uniref:TIGR01777 family oxidoreductase n=1 Tax=Nocardiopsis lambiniae TaxID=3075539 RepID=A0ABU2M812_9ACTN|nr:TIGR01777 family oxidoreductase [Nocardiopsis sp. DSM 44743]MDT0328765.1 TIGR01777 family oxidoreductase [Nocardiopsis sp. DSM 44743]
MKVAITGTSGLVGRVLVESLLADGHTVVRMVRHAPRPVYRSRLEEAEWRPEQGRVDTVALHGADAVVHLAGAPLGPSLWTRQRRALIRRSRVRGTRTLAHALAGMDTPPPRLLTASGMQYYGDTGGRVVTEADPPGAGFLADICRDWEGAAAPAVAAGISTAHLRLAVVLDRSGGYLRSVLPLYRAGLGGRIGSGAQYMTWIAMRDAVGVIRFLLERPGITGPINTCAPEPVSNAAFTEALAGALDRPAILRVPATALRATLGDYAEETALLDLRGRPERLLQAGYSFTLPTIDSALSDILARPVSSPGA